MMKLLITFLCFLVFAFSFDTTLNVVVEKDKPFIGEVNPMDIFGDVTIDVEGKFDKDLIVCLQEITNPPFRNRYTDCTFHFELKPEPVTTTGAATTGAATTAAVTTGASTTHDATTAAVTTGAAATTSHATTGASTTHHATTSAAVTTATAATTSHATTAAATTAHHATTSGAVTTAAVTTAAAATTAHHATTSASVTTAAVTTAAATTAHATTTHKSTTGTTFQSFKKSESVNSFKFSKKAMQEAAQMFPLRNVRYSVGVYYKTEPTEASKQTFSLKFSAKSCDAGKTGPNCEDDVARWPGNVWFIFEAGKTYFYNYTVDSGLNTLSISTSSDFMIAARFNGVPFGNISDASVATGKTVTLFSPRAGNWFIVLQTAAEGNSTIGTNEVRCAGGMVGTGCGSSVNTGVNSTVTHADVKLNASQIVYYSFVGQLNTLLVSARTVEVGDALKQPELFAGFNRAPQFVNGNAVAGTYDVAGCNVESCKFLTQINLRGGSAFAENGTWYVAVKAQEAKDHLFWIDFVCPANCSNTGGKTQGTCATSGADLGVCKCQPSYSADLLCSEADFLVEYIILIVIAALVAISAIIGLVAWAYMKSKHRGYEPV
jgi:hypothetical protein